MVEEKITAEIIDSPKETSSLATPPRAPTPRERLHSNEVNGAELADVEDEKKDEDELVEGEESTNEKELS